MKEALTEYKVAAINCEPKMFEKESNLTKQYALVEEAAKNGAKLIALPEMATTGYCWYDREEVEPYVEPIPGPTTDLFGNIAKKYDCYIVVGMPEVNTKTGAYYNSAALIGPDGVVGTHRKTHGYISEPKWTKQGDLDHVVFDTPIGKIGMLICMDIHFIETARLEGVRGADVIVHISNWLAEKTPAPYWINRAYENGCYVLESNRIGLERTVEFSGGSCLINPDGTLQSYCDSEETIVYGTVSLEKAREKKFENGMAKFESRRPKQYMDLLRDPYLWNPLDFHPLYGHDPLPKGKKSLVSVCQMQPSSDVASNLEKIISKSEEAAMSGSELVVFPELALCSEASPISEGCAEIDALIDCSMKNGIYIVFGAAEVDGSEKYNSAFMVGPHGLEGKYRKIHLNEEDKKWAKEGNLGFVYCNIPCGRVGLMIGSDALLPETGRILALKGCDILAAPSNADCPNPYGLRGTKAGHNYPIPKGYSTIHWHLWRVRGGENNCYMLFANAVSDKAFGRSGIFGPDTFKFPRDERICSADREELASMTIDTGNSPDSVYPTNVVRRKDLVSMRQPLWYDPLVM
ncbi:MAG: nitrilase-related carbon-nitrogen hydrolase [Spirochaetales bacterium]|nr:nitrilase-related carbon-nitrogen hydrolase [Spirochaetales bacterium]